MTRQISRPMRRFATQDSGRRQRGYPAKRLVDLAILFIALIPAVLLAAVCALGIKLTSRGPVFFRQQRVGLNGLVFRVFKFRSMIHDPVGNPLFPDDERITAFGRILRRFSLDELPQLINVIRGEMSVVGPRPTLPYQVARYTPVQRRRLSVRPGMTGLAQIRGRNSIEWNERIEHDLEYIDRQSPWLDMKIIWRSLICVLSGSGLDGHPPDDFLAKPPE
jgi:lipopolysaccharide/colanic/teichoic acid biosynthesis glycosyltransferase